jgi:formate dehydrogenase iron-sulfur subunit
MSVSRRGFLAGVAATAGATAASAAHAGGVERFPGYPGRYGLLHDTTLCVGCRSCERGCAQVNQLPAPTPPPPDKSVFDHERRTTPEHFTVVNRYEDHGKVVFRKHQCMHCNEPCCASVCLVHAFSKTPEGPVLYDPSVCMGCRYCVMACPYDALSYEYDDAASPRVRRCTMCYDRIKEGKQPGCAEACPTGAIVFGRRDDLLNLARERIRKQPERYINHIFGEEEFGGTSWLVLGGVPFGRLGLHEGVTHTSLPEIGTSYLSVVPLFVTIYPGLLAGIWAFTKRREALAEREREEAVEAVRTEAAAELKRKLDEAAKKAAADREKAVAQAVAKAQAEAARKTEVKP